MEIPIAVFMDAVTQETAGFLNKALPSVGGDNYWENYVLPTLSHKQRQQIEREQMTEVDELDLAAQIKVLIKHWSEFAYRLKIKDPDDSRTILHSMRDLRNKYSHAGAKRPPNKEVYRHLDTIQRYLEMIQANADTLDKVEGERKRILAAMSETSEKQSSPEQEEVDSDTPDTREQIEVPEHSDEEASDESGIELGLFTLDGSHEDRVKSMLAEATYVGIDFGTSTTIASYVSINEAGDKLTSIPIPVKQLDDLGRSTEDFLVPTCIAWTGDQLLVGQGAASLKADYEYGKNIWFSFKMKLGVDLGTPYYRSQLSGDDVPVNIQKPQHAAVVFFNYLREQVEDFVRRQGLPEKIVYSVSVPASFEANQRMDLVNALADAGLDVSEYGIIDEPNAAFISYLIETLDYGKGVIEGLLGKTKRILVFDFGAGTCDISILEVSGSESSIKSKNLAISQFHALGGDNIDRQIVRELLLDQLYEQNGITEDTFSSTELTEIIIPKLQKAAEDLKIQCSKYITNNWNGSDITPYLELDRTISGTDIDEFRVRDLTLSLKKPSMSFREFAMILESFVSPEKENDSYLLREEDIVNIFDPIYSALDKAEIDRDDLDSILFIGGSSLNPHVLAAVQSHFGRFVEALILQDLRTPVSQGAAIHSFMVNGIGQEFLLPILSEPIYVITSNGGLQQILPAGTTIPSPEIKYSELQVQRDGQEVVELPFCVTNEDKLLAVVELPAPKDEVFTKDQEIILRCAIDSNKLLQVSATIGDVHVNGTVLNPLANKEVSPEETEMLASKQRLYLNAASNNGRPLVSDMIAYAYACANADHHLAAAEAFEAAERLDNQADFATSICYHYSLGHKHMLSDKWARIDYERHPNAVSAFNLALTSRRHGDIDEFDKLMQESIKLDDRLFAALEIYGHHLHEKGDTQGINLVDRSFKIMSALMKMGKLDEADFPRLTRAAKTVGRKDVIAEMEAIRADKHEGVSYSDENLAASKAQEQPFQVG